LQVVLVLLVKEMLEEQVVRILAVNLLVEVEVRVQ
jgi:hypothetical protein